MALENQVSVLKSCFPGFEFQKPSFATEHQDLHNWKNKCKSPGSILKFWNCISTGKISDFDFKEMGW